MWKDFLPQESHKDLNFKSKYNGKSGKCLREIQCNRYFYIYIWQGFHGHFSGIHFLNIIFENEAGRIIFYFIFLFLLFIFNFIL